MQIQHTGVNKLSKGVCWIMRTSVYSAGWHTHNNLNCRLIRLKGIKYANHTLS